MKTIGLLIATLALVSCGDSGSGSYESTGMMSPSPSIGAAISPGVLSVTPIATSSCRTAVVFANPFNLVITAGSGASSVESVTFRLIDGSSVGGPSVTVPRPDLVQMFGSTRVVLSRAFAFRPAFGCSRFPPRAMTADVVLVDSGGRTRTVTAQASF